MRWWKKVVFSLSVIVVLCLVLTALAAVSSWLAYRSLVNGDAVTAQRYQHIATPVVVGLNRLTSQRSQTLQCWQTGLDSLALVSRVPTVIQQAGDSYSTTGTIDLTAVHSLVTEIEPTLATVHSCIADSVLLRLTTTQEKRDLWLGQLALLQTGINTIKPMLKNDQTWVMMFQNTTELRPTGGFTGSYALVELRDQSLQSIVVEDIYDADGQVQRFRDAPTGIREYTSSNNGLRLPDANWWPDFPTSARTQLDFLAEAGKKDLTGLVAINLSLLQDILRIAGPLELPDYQSTLTPENAPDLLRSHAENFFPGSRGKKQLLSYALSQLQYQLATTTKEQKMALWDSLMRAAATKEIQIFSTDSDQQANLAKLGVAAALDTTAHPVLALVEANVGINKSNRFISRSITVEQPNPQDLVVHLKLVNSANLLDPDLPASASGYVNYQRIITSPDLTLTNISSDTITKPNSIRESWSTSTGARFNEAGFLLTLLAGQEQTVTFQLKRTTPNQPVLLWHQSGTGPSSLQLTNSIGETENLSFDQDQLITP